MNDAPTWSDLEDWLADRIAATLGPDWCPRDAARLIVDDMRDGDCPVVIGGVE